MSLLWCVCTVSTDLSTKTEGALVLAILSGYCVFVLLRPVVLEVSTKATLIFLCNVMYLGLYYITICTDALSIHALGSTLMYRRPLYNINVQVTPGPN